MADKITGALEVGINESGEVVVNHPDLQPDENGVGHIVFSPNQARNLADLLRKHASLAEQDIRDKQEVELRKLAEAVPVDYDARVLVSGKPVTPDHKEINPSTGMQKDYVVLSAAERAKGFVRPVRDKYLHIGKKIEGVDYTVITPAIARQIRENGGCATHTNMSREIAETFARCPSGFYSGSFCISCRAHFPLDQFTWLGTNETVGS